MATNLALDDDLILQAQKIGGFKTKKETVNFILDDYVKRMKQQKILNLFGEIDFDTSYNYKKHRNRK